MDQLPQNLYRSPLLSQVIKRELDWKWSCPTIYFLSLNSDVSLLIYFERQNCQANQLFLLFCSRGVYSGGKLDVGKLLDK